MAVAQAVLSGLGYGERHFKLIEARDARDLVALDAALREAPATGVARAATFNALAGKRATLELTIDHLLAQAPQRSEDIALPAAGAPFGSLQVNTATCTMCLSCVGACPEGALLDNAERPQLRFIEKNCVQCGLCATTCPEERHHVAAAPVAGRRRQGTQGGACAARGGAVPMRALRQAVRHAARDRER